MKEEIARSVFWVAWSRGVVQMISFGATIMVARLLSPSDYGLMALAGIWTGTIAMVAELGLGGAVVQFRELDRRELNACFWSTMGVALAGYLVLYQFAPAIGRWFASPELPAVLRVSGLAILLVALRAVPDGLLRKDLRLDRVAQSEIISAAATVPVVLTMAWTGFGYWALVAGTLVMPASQAAAVFWLARWAPGVRMARRRLGEILRYSLAALGSNVCWSVHDQADSFMLGKISGDFLLGFYSMAKQLATLPVLKIAVVVKQLAVPVMAGLQTDREAMRASFFRGLRLVACLTVPVCVGLALVADDVVHVFLGEQWETAVPLLQLLSVLALIRSLEILLSPVLFALYRAGFMLRWSIALLFVMPIAFAAGAAKAGAFGVAAAWILVYPFVLWWMAREVLRELDTGWKAIGDQLLPVVFPTVLMVIAVGIVEAWFPADAVHERLLRLLTTTLGGALAYASGMLLGGGRVVGEISEVVGWMVRPRSRLVPQK